MKQTTNENLDQLELTIEVLRRKVEGYYEKKNGANRIDVVWCASEAITSLLDIIEDVQ